MGSRKSEDLIQIDRNSLDDEWVEQPGLYHRYAVALADAKQELDYEKANLDLVKAELDADIRTDPEAYGLARTTESAIESTILTQKRYRVAQKKVREAKHRVDVLSAAVGALDHRRKALENLVSLFLADYYSKPKAPDGAREKMAEVEKRVVRRKGR